MKLEPFARVLYLSYRRREHARLESLRMRFPLLETLPVEYDTARFDRFLALESIRS